MKFSTKCSAKKKPILKIIPILIALPIFFSCCSGNKTSKARQAKVTPKHLKHFSVEKPSQSQIVRHDESFVVSLTSENGAKIDSIKVKNNKKTLAVSQIDSVSYNVKLETELVGSHYLNAEIFYSDSLTESHTVKLFVLPNTEPVKYSYKVLRKFNHDPMAYTQGLLYKDGFLYESTGKKKQSSIRRLEVETGNVVKKKSLEPEFFGEGIAVVGKEIYMITYLSQVGFVYDAVTFDVIRKFNLQTKEGWGLTTYGSELILSDGSASLFFFDPKYFSLNRQIEVCDNNGLISKINELEYTKHGLFANIYGENHIVLIDEETGVVKGKVDLSELFPKEIPQNYEHVLNGIAYNPDKGTFYVTGKQWPVIYEIEINLD